MPVPSLDRIRSRGTGLARRAARKAVRSQVARRLRGPALSVVVPVYNVEEYLAECLDSIVAQGFDDFEVLLVDDGSPDGSRRIAEEYAARDPRFRVVTRPNGGLGAARNTGVRAAKGRFLTFVDSDDVLPEHAFQVLMGAALSSGSDIVVGAVERFDTVRRWRPTWVETVHEQPRTGVRIQDALPLLRNLYTWNKVFRRDFWDKQDLWFREGVAYEDQPIITQLLARASASDVVPDVVYFYRARDDKSSISQQTASLTDLRARIKAWEVSRDAFRAELSQEVYDGWLATLFDAHFQWYLQSKGTVDDDYWTELVAAVRDFTAGAASWIWDATDPGKRVLIELARQDRRADAQEFVRQDALREDRWPTTTRDDGVLLHLPFFGDPSLPDDLFLLRPEQLTVAHAVEKFAWVEGEEATFRISGWAFVPKVDLSRFEAGTEVLVRNERTGAEHAFPATSHPAAALPPPVDDLWCDYGPGTFGVDVPMAQVLADGGPDDRWLVQLRITVGGFTVTRTVNRLLRNGSAGIIPAFRLADGSRLTAEWAFRQALRFRRDRAGVAVHDVRLEGRVLTGRLAGPGADDVDRVEAVAGPLHAGAKPGDEGRFRLALPAGALPGPGSPLTWRIEARLLDARTTRLVTHGDLGAPAQGAEGGLLVPETNRNGELAVDEWQLGATADDVAVQDDGSLLVSGRVFGTATGLSLATRGLKVRGDSAFTEVADGRFTARLDLRHELFRFGARPLPIGDHDVHALVHTDEDGTGTPVEVPLVVSAGLGSRLPLNLVSDVHEGAVVRGPHAVLRVHLLRPIGEARGKYHQHLLRTADHAAGGLTRCLLVRSYFGEQATDNGISVQRELQRRGADLPVYWAVQDHSIPVPEGGIPVVVNSAEWYRLLGSAAYYLDNMYQPEYHHKPEGQVIVQTFHGYPFKQMGHTHWRAQQFSQAKIDAYDARANEWDFLVSPARYATPLLTREFNYQGEVLEIGYPRNDVLQSAEADVLRDRVRESLGIPEGQTAVLYAPTFRDYLAENDNRALMADFFDFAAAHRALGDDIVFLVRGHAFNARVKKRMKRMPGCIDVTDYPEVSDLYLAADAAIVDYSSLRFDFGVTGKPMIFHVPDLKRYQDTRGWLFDFEPTAPGPLVDTTDEVVERLRDLDGVRREYAAAYERFRADYLDLEDGRAGERFVDAVIAPRGDA
jgi:CDP-glycerol glycerophosphotransferase